MDSEGASGSGRAALHVKIQRYVSLFTSIRNFAQGELFSMKKLFGMFALLILLTTLVVACGGNGGTSSSNTVNLAASTFSPATITIKKGQSITLSNQTATTHIISNGTWNGNTPVLKAETGAPTMSNVIFNSANETKTVGPFNTAGTYHYYCSVHPGMNLTVTVQ
jgi:plastocyanin